MAGDALLPSPVGRDRTFPDLLELFAASMLRRRESDDTTRRIAARARDAARAEVTSARAPVGTQQTLALRSIYDEVRALGSAAALEATGENAPAARTRSARAFDATLRLRHRQRAALLLHDLGGLPVAAVAEAIGVSPAQVHAIVEGARASVTKRLGEPLNVRRALASAGRGLITAPSSPAPPPRSIVATSLSTSQPAQEITLPTATAPPHGSIRLSPPEGLLIGDPQRLMAAALVALEASPPDITYAARGVVARPAVRAPIMTSTPRRAPLRALLVAACAVLAAVVIPASADAPRTASPPPDAPRVSATVSTPAVAAPRPARTRAVAAAPSVVVRRGDSLSALAERHLGDGARWPELWELNARLRMPGGRFTDPDLIHPGWRLKLPAR